MEAVRQYIRERVVVEDRGHSSPCWIWQREIDYKGYGRGFQSTIGRFKAHRGAHLAFIGPIPDGFDVDHLCFVRCCVNPTHLEAVTPEENNRRKCARLGLTYGGDRRKKGRAGTGTGGWQRFQTHCPRGHQYTAENLARSSDGARRCLACRLARRAEYNALKRQRRTAARETRRGEAVASSGPIQREIAPHGEGV